MSVCVRCGFCCKNCCVAVVDNPILGITEDNLIFHEGRNTPCKHLIGSAPGEYSCAVHEERWYPQTPCYSHNNEFRHGQPCLLGKSVIARYRKEVFGETIDDDMGMFINVKKEDISK